MNQTNKTNRKNSILILILVTIIVSMIILSGCSSGITGNTIKTIKTEERPITETIDVFEEQPITKTETKIVGRNCIEKHYSELNESELSIYHEDKEWVTEPATWGASNELRRVVLIHNGLDEIDTAWVDKVYYEKGIEVKRSRNPMKLLIDAQATRKVYAIWNTQFHPDKDVKLVFSNNTEAIGVEISIQKMCFDETEKVDITEYKKVKVGEEEVITGYNQVTRVILK